MPADGCGPVIHRGDGNLNPRLFQLGLLAGLQGQYVGIVFDALVVKGATTGSLSFPPRARVP
jgi:hypothetical protein